MADGYFPLTSDQQNWAERAADIAQRELAPRAAETDRGGTFPSEGLEALKKGDNELARSWHAQKREFGRPVQI